MSLIWRGRRMKGRSEHPTEKMLGRFVQGTTSRAENRAIVAHLLRRCDRCSRVVAKAGGELLKTLRPSAERAS
jgi:anti-sigma factor ChrR (cupin superfamily)